MWHKELRPSSEERLNQTLLASLWVVTVFRNSKQNSNAKNNHRKTKLAQQKADSRPLALSFHLSFRLVGLSWLPPGWLEGPSGRRWGIGFLLHALLYYCSLSMTPNITLVVMIFTEVKKLSRHASWQQSSNNRCTSQEKCQEIWAEPF